MTNPVDLGSVELLDRAWLGPFNSGAELIEAEALDDARFVKAFNTTFAGALCAGALDGSPLDAFVAGDDQTAKDTIMQLASDGGLRAIDAGRLRCSRELDALALLHIEIQGYAAPGLLRRSRWCPEASSRSARPDTACPTRTVRPVRVPVTRTRTALSDHDAAVC